MRPQVKQAADCLSGFLENLRSGSFWLGLKGRQCVAPAVRPGNSKEYEPSAEGAALPSQSDRVSAAPLVLILVLEFESRPHGRAYALPALQASPKRHTTGTDSFLSPQRAWKRRWDARMCLAAQDACNNQDKSPHSKRPIVFSDMRSLATTSVVRHRER